MRDVRTNQPFCIVVTPNAGKLVRALLAKDGRPHTGLLVNEMGCTTPGLLLPGPDTTLAETIALNESKVGPVPYYSVDAFRVVTVVTPASQGESQRKVIGKLGDPSHDFPDDCDPVFSLGGTHWPVEKG